LEHPSEEAGVRILSHVFTEFSVENTMIRFRCGSDDYKPNEEDLPLGASACCIVAQLAVGLLRIEMEGKN
jgi:hypothetical protein